MITLIFIILFGIFALKFNKSIRKHQVILYLLATGLAVFAFVKFDIPVLKPITQGFLALALFYLVMLAGALPDKTKWKIALISVRKEYSIFGFIIATPHALHYFMEYLNGEIAIPIYGIIAYVIMIPLFITSFRVIRKKMSYQVWKSLQKFAYITYALLAIHLVLNFSETVNLILYIVIFSLYGVYKTIKVTKQYRKAKPIKTT